MVAVLMDILLAAFGEPLMSDVADPSKLPSSAPPLVTWGNLAVDWWFEAVVFSLLVYLLVGAWIESQATGGI
jgi:hypothetical protein